MFSKKSTKPEVIAQPYQKPVNWRSEMAAEPTFAVINPDVTIKGNISAKGDLHIDGEIEGDITCATLVQGQQSSIQGVVKAESARLAGKLSGSITAQELIILKTAHVEGEIYYDALTIEPGAQIDGRIVHNTRPTVRAVPDIPVETKAAGE
jgi:cytoskeletal protein CcmA (bactofilin family)